MKRLVFVSPLLLLLALPAAADEFLFEPLRDASIYEPISDGEPADGQSALLAGYTNSPEGDAGPNERRALLAFDVTLIEPGTQIESVQLGLHSFFQHNQAPATDFSLYRLEESWTEGPSDSGLPPGSGGGSLPPQTDDVTWSHRSYDISTWTTPGGSFAATASATTTVTSPGGYTWGSTSELVADVQAWVDDPSSNHGWILLAETDGGIPIASARFFDSGETGVGPQRGQDPTAPVLVVTTVEGAPLLEIPTLGATGAGLLVLLLGAFGIAALRRRAGARI